MKFGENPVGRQTSVTLGVIVTPSSHRANDQDSRGSSSDDASGPLRRLSLPAAMLSSTVGYGRTSRSSRSKLTGTENAGFSKMSSDRLQPFIALPSGFVATGNLAVSLPLPGPVSACQPLQTSV